MHIVYKNNTPTFVSSKFCHVFYPTNNNIFNEPSSYGSHQCPTPWSVIHNHIIFQSNDFILVHSHNSNQVKNFIVFSDHQNIQHLFPTILPHILLQDF